MGYCFMTLQKIKTKTEFSKKFQHNYRENDISNADKNLSNLNEELVSLNGKDYNTAFEEKINGLEYYKSHDIRKDAVLGYEIVTTFSREDAEHINIEDWKKDNVEWLEKTFNANERAYGNNVISIMYHVDEPGNVHCHAIVVPIDDKGKLNASFYTKGKDKMIELQNSYGKMMKARHDLDRGLKNSRATHQDIKRFYAELNNRLDVKPPEINKGESVEEYKKRCDEFVKDLQASQLREVKKLEREIAVQKTKYSEPLIEKNEELKQANKRVQELESIEHEFGPISTIKAKLRTTERLQDAFDNYPDVEKTNQVLSDVQEFVKWSKDREKEEQKRNRNIYKKKGNEH